MPAPRSKSIRALRPARQSIALPQCPRGADWRAQEAEGRRGDSGGVLAAIDRARDPTAYETAEKGTAERPHEAAAEAALRRNERSTCRGPDEIGDARQGEKLVRLSRE